MVGEIEDAGENRMGMRTKERERERGESKRRLGIEDSKEGKIYGEDYKGRGW